MIGFVIPFLLAIAFLTALAVLIPSLAQAWATYGELRQALSRCDNDRLVTVRFADTARRAAPQPRRQMRVGMRPMPAGRTGVLRAAA